MIPVQAVELAKRFEGLRLRRYLCPAGVWTIGYGSTKGVTETTPDITPEWAETLLQLDLAEAASAAHHLCPGLAGEPDGRQSALIDFVFNLGAGRLQTSTLRRRVNAGEWDRVPDELNRWVYARGRRLPGLVLRRAAEVALI